MHFAQERSHGMHVVGPVAVNCSIYIIYSTTEHIFSQIHDQMTINYHCKLTDTIL